MMKAVWNSKDVQGEQLKHYETWMKQFDTVIKPNPNAIFFFQTGSHALKASVQVTEDANRPNYKTGYAGKHIRLKFYL